MEAVGEESLHMYISFEIGGVQARKSVRGNRVKGVY